MRTIAKSVPFGRLREVPVPNPERTAFRPHSSRWDSDFQVVEANSVAFLDNLMHRQDRGPSKSTHWKRWTFHLSAEHAS